MVTKIFLWLDCIQEGDAIPQADLIAQLKGQRKKIVYFTFFK
jgi:hypothetical protein